nr:YafY family protein [Massilia sp. TS11]
MMDVLRAHRRPVTAAYLAERMGVSERTIYRDLRMLAELGAPVDGAAGVGFQLRAGLFLPPLMFNADELEALVLGARWVRKQGDPELAQAAEQVLAKVATASPRDLREHLAQTSLWVPVFEQPHSDPFVAPARRAIREERKLRIAYRDEQGRSSERTLWPFALAFFQGKRLLAAWCELRQERRYFRIDRIERAELLDERYPERRQALLAAWRQQEGISEDS